MTITAQRIRVFGVPMDLGQQRRGVDMGPSAIRYAGLQRRLEHLGHSVLDGGNIGVQVMEEIGSQYQWDDDLSDGIAHHVPAIMRACKAAHEAMLTTIESNEVGVFLGGDHSISIGTISAALHRKEPIGVLWVDAHGDFNTPFTTPSGNVHGMVVSSLMGRTTPELMIGDRKLEASQIVMIGIRDLDPPEREALKTSGIRVYTMRDIDERGMATVAREALDYLKAAGALHVSWDMDSLDPHVVEGVGTPVPGGLTYREAHLLAELIADDGRLRSLDIVEVNPILDQENKTASVAVEIAVSLFGQRIL